MSAYRINIFNTFENILARGAFSVPNSSHSTFGQMEEESSWKIVEKIKKGNVILLCRGVRQIWGIAIASDDCRITDIDAFEEILRYEEKGFRFVTIDIYREFKSPVDGIIFFKGLLQNNPFDEELFCMELKHDKKKEAKFIEAMNKLLSTH
ncbi:MAG: hypothetical protein IT569_06020 [Leptospiraceae bacterium]|nr:hypothetical protein [Leptospiraceae bacterium]